jgi:hypothetical protein
MQPSNSNLGAHHRVNHHLIQTQWPRHLATDFELECDLLGGRGNPSLNQMALSNINLDVAIQASFAGFFLTLELILLPLI